LKHDGGSNFQINLGIRKKVDVHSSALYATKSAVLDILILRDKIKPPGIAGKPLANQRGKRTQIEVNCSMYFPGGFKNIKYR
jgi:hypothetical protein